MRNVGYYSSSDHIDRIVSNGSSSSLFSSDCIEGRLEAIYTLSDVVLSGIPASMVPSPPSSRVRDLGLVRDNHYVFHLRLIEVEVLIKVSDSCSNVQKLFSVIGNNGGNVMYKNSFRSAQKNTQDSTIGQETINQPLFLQHHPRWTPFNRVMLPVFSKTTSLCEGSRIIELEIRT